MHRLINGIIYLGASCKTHLQLPGMHVYVQVISRHLNMQGNKRKFMLHHKALIRILDGLCDNVIFHKPAIYIVIFKASIAS